MLVAGTTIGAGMLGLPLVTGFAGFYPSILLILVYWLVMLYTAFMTLEVTLWFPYEVNFVTMAEKTLGSFGKWITWAVYLFLLYALTTAYLAGLNPLVLDFFECVFGWALPVWSGYIPILLLFGFFIYRGFAWVEHANRWMMCGMLLTFIFILIFLSPNVDSTLLQHRNWGALPIAFAVLATSFGYHIIIPSLVTYLDRNVEDCKRAIWIGSIVPVVVYIIWEWLSLGIIPVTGPLSLESAAATGMTSGELLAEITQFGMLKGALRIFSLFLIVTSFLGVSISLFDFLADGLRIKKTRIGKSALFFLTFIPPVLICLRNPYVFLDALDYAGAYGVVTLLVILPCAFIFFGRKEFSFSQYYRVRGGNVVLVLILIFAILVMGNDSLIKLP